MDETEFRNNWEYKGLEIKGIPKDSQDSIVFQAGTKTLNEKTLTNGGRVLSVTSIGKDFNDALMKSYKIADKIDYQKKYYRKDLGFDL